VRGSERESENHECEGGIIRVVVVKIKRRMGPNEEKGEIKEIKRGDGLAYIVR
jgi:hypothetical protein